MTIDIQRLLGLLNKNTAGGGGDLAINYCSNNDLEFANGNVKYFADHKKLMSVLDGNGVDLYDQDKVYETLFKHVLNQLFASHGQKAYPEIVSVESDLI